MSKDSKKRYDLGERTAKFAEAAIGFAKTIPRNVVNTSIIRQLVRSATSVGANYCEADNAESDNDFVHKMAICRKEANETQYWLRMVSKAEPDLRAEARELWKEARELHLIFVAIIRKVRKRLQKSE